MDSQDKRDYRGVHLYFHTPLSAPVLAQRCAGSQDGENAARAPGLALGRRWVQPRDPQGPTTRMSSAPPRLGTFKVLTSGSGWVFSGKL